MQILRPPPSPTNKQDKRDKSSRGSVDTTKTHLGPQRVRKSSGERPIGAAKGKQSDTKALCQTPSPPPPRINTPCVLCHHLGMLCQIF